MPYDRGLEFRIEEIISDEKLEKKKMFGGIVWLLNGRICFGISKDNMILRIGKENASQLSQNEYITIMNFSGRPMKAWVEIDSEAIEDDKLLSDYIKQSLVFVENLDN